jgi:hypothetical protein
VTTDFAGNDDAAFAVARQTDGKLVAAGGANVGRSSRDRQERAACLITGVAARACAEGRLPIVRSRVAPRAAPAGERGTKHAIT